MQLFGFALLVLFSSFTKGNTNKAISIDAHEEISFVKKNGLSSYEAAYLKAIQASESSVNQADSNSLTSSSEEPTVKVFSTNKGIEQVINFQYLQYVKTEKNFLILSKKAQLIFPFHYHW